MRIIKYGDIRAFGEPGHEQAVERGEWRRDAGEMYTTRVSTGIILAALNPSRGEGVLGHFCNLSEPSPQLSDRYELDKCLSQIQALGIYDTKVWTGGASTTFVNNKIGQKWLDRWVNAFEDRRFIEKELTTHNLDFIADWAPDNAVTYASLDPSVGRLAISQFELSNLQ